MSNISSAKKAIKNRPKEIKIGIKVEMIKNNIENGLIKKGMKATIIEIKNDNGASDLNILLEFKENIDGHEGNQNLGKTNRCWYVNRNEIKII